MRKMLLISHSKLALGLKQTLEFFTGQSEDIVALAAYLDEGSDYLIELQEFIDNAKEENAVIFTDIYGGSVNQQVTAMIIGSGKEIPIITGMNLPIVLSVALAEKDLSTETIKGLCEECKPQLVEVQRKSKEEGDVDEFFA